MLVLSRKIGEKIVVGDGITITVLAARNGRARLGLTAPKETRIDRQEIFEKRKAGNGELAMTLDHDVV